MATQFEEVDDGAGKSLQRAIVLHLLECVGERRLRVDLRIALGGEAERDVEAALIALEREGVIELGELDVRTSTATGRLDALGLIGI